jgi:release factor glutamine methyltransferase
MINIKQALNQGKVITLDSEILLCHILKVNKAHLYTYPEQNLSDEQYNQYAELINLRAQGIPIAYILGYKEFWSLKFHVSNKTLIPREDTEL